MISRSLEIIPGVKDTIAHKTGWLATIIINFTYFWDGLFQGLPAEHQPRLWYSLQRCLTSRLVLSRSARKVIWDFASWGGIRNGGNSKDWNSWKKWGVGPLVWHSWLQLVFSHYLPSYNSNNFGANFYLLLVKNESQLNMHRNIW